MAQPPARLFQFTEHLQRPAALRERTDAPGQLGHHGDFEGRRHAPLRQREQRAGALSRWDGPGGLNMVEPRRPQGGLKKLQVLGWG